ncbi:MAG TPA: helix-hairpin-helix domain-containing protein [Lachnospiraceae bacterium]|nr:helix-hairpin-helix domain-containing protein [Lachnospiraceae bacterium]
MKNYKDILTAGIICGLLLSACGNENEIILSKEETVVLSDTIENMESMENMESVKPTFNAYYYIYICGSVKDPGVYEVVEGMRLYEVIDLAGGFTTDACEDYLNQALQVEDGQKIYIPTETEVASGNFDNTQTIIDTWNSSSSSLDSNHGLVNINAAMVEELCTLPGIGSSRAQDIITYREQSGTFKSIEEIQKVNGIKEGVFAKIKDLITVK